MIHITVEIIYRGLILVFYGYSESQGNQYCIDSIHY